VIDEQKPTIHQAAAYYGQAGRFAEREAKGVKPSDYPRMRHVAANLLL